MTEEGTDNLLLVSVYKDLLYDDTGTSYATGKMDLSGSYDCTSDQEENNDNADDVDDEDGDTTKKTKSGLCSFTLTSLSSSGKTPASIYTVEGFASSCNGVATLTPKVPLPEVYSVSMGLQGHCLSTEDEEGTTTSAMSSLFLTLLFDLKVNRTTTNNIENDDDGVESSSSSLLLLEGQWADSQGDQGSVTCARTNSNNR